VNKGDARAFNSKPVKIKQLRKAGMVRLLAMDGMVRPVRKAEEWIIIVLVRLRIGKWEQTGRTHIHLVHSFRSADLQSAYINR
jgi:hypothetical protein